MKQQVAVGVQGIVATSHIRRFAQRQALGMEIKFPGMKMTRGRTAYSRSKRNLA